MNILIIEIYTYYFFFRNHHGQSASPNIDGLGSWIKNLSCKKFSNQPELECLKLDRHGPN